MQACVEDLDNLAADIKGVRDIDDVSEQIGDPSGSSCVAKRPEQQDRAAGIDRRQQLFEIMLGNHQPGKTLPERVLVQLFVSDTLPFDLSLIARQINRGWAEIQFWSSASLAASLPCSPSA